MKVNKCLKRCIHELSPILRIIYKCFKWDIFRNNF
jgi:hypothetical protein